MSLPVNIACAGCYLKFADPLWIYFSAAQVLVACYVADQRMRTLPIFGIFCAYEIIYYFIFHILIHFAHPTCDYIFAFLFSNVAIYLMASGLPAVFLFKFVSGFHFFRGNRPIPVTWLRSLLIIPMKMFVGLVETVVIGTGGFNSHLS